MVHDILVLQFYNMGIILSKDERITLASAIKGIKYKEIKESQIDAHQTW